MFDRSAAVRLQLRDKKGRFIKMGDHVKWHSLEDNMDVSGIARGQNGGNVIVEFSKGGKTYHINVPHNKIEAIQEKAHLDQAYVEKMGGHINTPNPNQPGVTVAHTVTHYAVNSKDPSQKLTTPISDLKPGDKVYPIKPHEENTPSSIQKSPFNSKDPSSMVNMQKFKGLGTVKKVVTDKDTGKAKYAIIEDHNGKEHFPSASHHAVKQSDHLDEAILKAHGDESNAMGKDTAAKLVQDVKGAHTTEDHFDAASAPVGSKLQAIGAGKKKITITKTGENQWQNSANGTKLTDEVADKMLGPAPEIVKDDFLKEENPFGDNYVKLNGLTNYKKGDTIVLKDGSIGAWVGKGQLTLEDGSTIPGNRFSVDGKERAIAGKDIAASYRPKSLVVPTTGPNPFGDGFTGYSFDLGKPNNENFKPGDQVVYGKEKNEGKVLKVTPNTILVEKLNSDKKNNGTATIVAGQVHGKYVKDKSSSDAPEASTSSDSLAVGTRVKLSEGKDASRFFILGEDGDNYYAVLTSSNNSPVAIAGFKSVGANIKKFPKDSVESVPHIGNSKVNPEWVKAFDAWMANDKKPLGSAWKGASQPSAPEAPAEDAPQADEPAPAAAPEEAPDAPEEAPAEAADTPTFPDKGKTGTDSAGNTIKVNDKVAHPKKGVGTIAIVLPSTDSVKSYYPDGTYAVHKQHTVTKVDGAEAKSPDTLPANMQVGDSAIDPTTHTKFIVGKNNSMIHIGDKVTHSNGDTGTATAIYTGEKNKTVSVLWADGTKSTKKSSVLESEHKLPDTTGDKPAETPETTPEAPETPAPAQTPAVADLKPYTAAQEKALVDFKAVQVEIGHHLRGNGDGSFENAGPVIYAMDDLLKESTLSEPATVWRGFSYKDSIDPHATKLGDTFAPGVIFRDKSFVSTSHDQNVALQSVAGEDGHKVLVKFDLPAGYHAHNVNYAGISDEKIKGESHEQEMILPRNMDFVIKSVEKGTDADGNPITHLSVAGVLMDPADGQIGHGTVEVNPETGVAEKPFQILDDPGADGDGYHPSGSWGLFGAAGVMVEANDPKTGEKRYLIVENGELHEEKNRGLWQLPGGALNGNENPYQGAAREMHEELDVHPDTLAAFSHAGDVVYSNGEKGSKEWKYHNVAAVHDGPTFDVKIDVIETSDHKWVTADELKQMGADGKLLPAFAANVDKLLGVYGKNNGTAPVETNTKSIKDFEKVPGEGQMGSNSGGMYTDKATGEKYYIKSGMSEDHARNEILASKIYQAMGVNASNQEPIDLGNGKLGVASKIIETDGHTSNIHLDDPEYLKKVQSDFAIDALLANWDVAGMGYDNLLTDANGNPLRIDPGASLRYRAQGSPKSKFDGTADEWDFLRTGTNHESSGLKYNKKLFGSMSNQQLIDSAHKLDELTDDKIDSIVDSIGFDKKDDEFFKQTLKARRDDILKRASLLEDPTKKDDNGQQEGPTGDSGTPAASEAGPESGQPVPVDSGSGDDLGSAEAGEVAPKIGQKLSMKQVDSLPVGSAVKYTYGGSPLELLDGNKWELPNGETIDHDHLMHAYTDDELELVHMPGAVKEDPKVGDKLTMDEVGSLPAGSVVQYGGGSQMKLLDNGKWQLGTGGTVSTDQLNHVYDDHDLMLKFLPEAAAPEAPAADAVPSFAVGENVKAADLHHMPIGSKVSQGTFHFEKKPNGSWSQNGGNNPISDEQLGNFFKDGLKIDEVGSTPSADDATPSSEDLVGKKLGTSGVPKAADLPSGTVISINGDTTAAKQDVSSGMWKLENGNLMHEDTIDYIAGISNVTIEHVGDGSEPFKFANMDSYPAGTVLNPGGMAKLVKQQNGQWKSTYTGTEFDTQAIKDSYSEGDLTVDPPAKPYSVGDKVLANDIHALPVGAEIEDKHHILYSKTAEGEWVTDYGKEVPEHKVTHQDDSFTVATMPESTPQATPEPAAPSVPGKNGEPISVGDDILWESKGLPGFVSDINVEAGKVQMMFADGSTKWYQSSKMVKQNKPATPAKPVVKKEVKTDPSSPFYGQPKPAMSAPTGDANEDQTYLPDGFIEEIEQRYAAKLNPKWSKATPQQSLYWNKVTEFQNTGDISALTLLHEKLYISDEMFAKAKERIAGFAEKKKELDAQKAKALTQYEADLKAWKEANGVVSTGFTSDRFPPAATAAEEWTKDNGFITLSDGTQAADWSKAPEGSHSVESILSSMEADDELAGHGMSAMIDSDWIRDNNVRFTKVVDDNGVARLQARFDVSAYHRQDVINQMGPGTSSEFKAGFFGYAANKLFSVFSKQGSGINYVDGKTYTKKVGNTDITFQNSQASGWTNNLSTLDAAAYITLPQNATTQDFERALKAMGITDAHPSPKESVDFSKKKQLVSTFLGFVGEGNTKYEENPALLDTHVNKVLSDVGHSIDDFKLVHTELGFYQYRVPTKLRDKLTAETGVKALSHGNIDFMNETHNSKYKYGPDGKKVGSVAYWSPSDSSPMRVLKRFTGAAKGYLSTGRRILEGDNAEGMSPDADIRSGGARYLFTTPMKGNNWIHDIGYETGVVAHPSLAFQYLGNYANSDDNGSGKRQEGNVLKDVMGGYYGGSPEVMILNGISIKDSWFTFTNPTQKPVLLEKLREEGIDEINGMPIEQYFVIPGVDPIPEWNDPHALDGP